MKRFFLQLAKYVSLIVGTVLLFVSSVLLIAFIGAAFNLDSLSVTKLLVIASAAIVSAAIGALLMHIANDISYQDMQIGDSTEQVAWMLQSNNQPLHGKLELDGKQTKIRFLSEDGQEFTFPPQEIDSIRLSYFMTATYMVITYKGQAYTFHPYKLADGLAIARKLRRLSVILGHKLSVVIVGLAAKSDPMYFMPPDFAIIVHRWLKIHRIRAYRQLLGPSESSVALMLVFFPVCMIFASIMVSIFNR